MEICQASSSKGAGGEKNSDYNDGLLKLGWVRREEREKGRLEILITFK